MSPAQVKDFYKILGLSENASKDEIKKVFRKLAIKYHPDKTKGDRRAEERFKEINEAYQVLVDDEKRKQYDFMRKNPFGAAFGTGRGGAQTFRFNMEDLGGMFGGGGGLGDLFNSFFSTTRGKKAYRRRASTRGSNIQTSITIPFTTAVQGGKHTLRISKDEVCPNCGGSGAQPGSRVTTCPQCGGSGSIFVSQGAFGVNRTCPECLGMGKKITRPCADCHGTGKVHRKKTITVKIPAGIKDGQKIRLAGEGEPGINGGPNGDLYIHVNVQSHPLFKRDGNKIYSEKEIDLPTAILGGKVNVETLQGPVTLKIPAGTQSGTKFKLKKRGIRFASGRIGDHYVTIKVRIPKKLTREQARLFSAFASSLK